MARLRLATAALAAGLALSGCASVTLQNTFNPAEASIINKQGTASIAGQAFLRRNDGIVVYGAGSEVVLIPKTTYSTERINAIYKGGHIAYFTGGFKNDDQTYYSYTRKTVADGEGRFTFENVAAGTYYLSTAVTWMVKYQQGGTLMAEVSLAEGQKIEIIMNGQ